MRLLNSEESIISAMETLESCLPKSSMIYNVLKLKSELSFDNDATTKMDIKIFVHGNTDDIDGYVAIIDVKGLPQALILIFCSKTPSYDFFQALENLIDWSRPNQFEGMENDVASFIENCCKNKGRTILHPPIGLYFMDREEATKLNPQGNNHHDYTLVIKSLDSNDAKKVDACWPAACIGSLQMLKLSIEFVGSGGVYLKEINNNQNSEEDEGPLKLVSHAVAVPFGSIHALHTESEHQGKGFAKMTMKVVAMNVAEKGRIPVVQIYKQNDTSKILNLKVGFKFAHDINLIHYYPE